MREKLVAGLVATTVIAPLCAACIFGPAVLASVIAGLTGWLRGFDPVVIAGLALFAGIAVYGIVHRRRARRAPAGRAGEVSR